MSKKEDDKLVDPVPACRHGEAAFVDRELGILDDNHIYCPCCGTVVCFNVFAVNEKSGRCRKCNSSVSESQEKLEDGIGKITWRTYDKNDTVINGGTL